MDYFILIGFISQSIMNSARKRDRNSNLPDARWPACTLDPE